MEKRKLNTRSMIMMAMLGAIAAVLMFLEISVPFAPGFVKFDLSDLPVLVSGFLFGPALGILTASIKIIIKLVIKPTSTAFVGELSNFILAAIFVGVSCLIYRQNKTKKGAMIGMAISTLVTAVVSVLTNWWVIFPMYAKMFGMSMDQLVQIAAATNPLVKDVVTMFILSIFPFNIFKYGVISLVTLLIYKKISNILKKYMQS